MALLGGLFTGIFTTVASASTFAVSLDMTAGTFATQGGTPGPLPTMATPAFTATETTRAGTLNDATLKIPTQNENNTGSKETIIVSVAPATTVAATVNTLGDLTIAATLVYEVHITSPVTAPCKTTPVHVVLSSTAPYTTTSKSVTVKNSNITVPNFSATGCIASSELDATFAGAGGELGLTLHGTLVVPPPGTPTTVSLSATPASPQVRGASVTIKATVKKTTGTPATTAKGLVTFYDGTTTLGTASASGGTASYTTSALPIGTDPLSAVYGGGGGYKGSTSSPFTFVVAPAPSVSVTGLPASVTGGTATEHDFSVTVTNPASGLNWTKLYIDVVLTGLRNVSKTILPLQFQDGKGTWCSPIGFAKTSTTSVRGFAVGTTSTCTPASYPASFSLAAGSPLTVNFRISWPKTNAYGIQNVGATLYTGTCTSATKCTAVAPLSGVVAPSGSETVDVFPPSPLGTKITDGATRKATSTVHQTFDVGIASKVSSTVTTGTTTLPQPTGSVSYAIDGTTVATGLFSEHIGDQSDTALALFNTAGLTVGKHQLVSTYTPESYTGRFFYTGSSLTETFTVIAAPTGTPFTCVISGEDTGTIPAYVTATGTVPVASLATSTKDLTAQSVSVTLDADPVLDARLYNTTQSIATLGFSPTGSAASAKKTTFTGTTSPYTTPSVVGTWTETTTTVPISTEIPIKKGTPPGTVIPIGTSSISFSAVFSAWTCKPTVATTPAPVASTEIAGTTLSVTPTSAAAGTPVTLTATVYPTPTSTSSASTVTFSASSHTLGTVPVTNTGPTAGKAKLTETTLAAGRYTVVAKWSGNGTPTVPANTSNAVKLSLRSPGGGVPVTGTYTCATPIGTLHTVGITFEDLSTVPATLEPGQHHTLKPQVTFPLTPTLIGLAVGAGQFTFAITAAKLRLKLTGFTTTGTKTLTATNTPIEVQIGSKTVQVTTTGTLKTVKEHTTAATEALHGGQTWVASGVTLLITFPTVQLTMGTKTVATVTPTGKVTVTVLTLGIPCTATKAPGPMDSIGVFYAPLTLGPASASTLPTGQAGVTYKGGRTYWTVSGGHGTNTWTETGTLDGLVFHGTGDHASLTGTPTTPGTFTFSVTVKTKTDPVTHTYALHIATAPATPTTVQPFTLTVTPGTLTLTCTSADGPTLPNVATDVTSQATAKPCTEITLSSVTLNEKRQDVTTHGHNLIISTARGGATDSWALYAVMVPSTTGLTGNPFCDAVQGFCNVGTTNGTTLANHFKNTTITPNYLGLAGQKCTPNSNPSTTYFNDNPTPTSTAGAAPGTPGLAAQTKLCSATTGNAGGQFFVTTLDYTLIVPPNVYVGTYYGTVLYTLSSNAANVPPNPVTPPQ